MTNDREELHLFLQNIMHREKYSNINCALCRVVNPSKKVPDFNCELQDLSTEVVDLKNEVPDPVVKVVMCSRGGGLSR